MRCYNRVIAECAYHNINNLRNEQEKKQVRQTHGSAGDNAMYKYRNGTDSIGKGGIVRAYGAESLL